LYLKGKLRDAGELEKPLPKAQKMRKMLKKKMMTSSEDDQK
jgi:hypothetical protein